MAMVYNDRFLEILIHDLRSPLNVLKLSLHMMQETARAGAVPPEEDLRLMRQNIEELERMLTVLVQFAQLPGGGEGIEPVTFDPARMLRDQVDLFAERNREQPVKLELQGAPAEVRLSPALFGLAVGGAIENAAVAASVAGHGRPTTRHPIRVVLRGGPSRCVVEVAVEGPPKDSVQTTELRPELYQRVLGAPGERRGIDLATAARVSELFGGSARLVAEPGRSVVVLDWPADLAVAS
jgi:signal transduction histidine kinase